MTSEEPFDQTALSGKELELVKTIATRDGISVDEAASRLAKQALSRRVRRRSGRGPAKVYALKGRAA